MGQIVLRQEAMAHWLQANAPLFPGKIWKNKINNDHCDGTEVA